MSGAPRVLIVSRRFWPSCTDSTQRLMNLACGLQSDGASLSVLTAKWHASWSSRIDVREIPVFRFEAAPTNPLRTSRYCRALADWFHSKLGQFDVVYCDAADLEAQVLLTQVVASQRPPCIIRFDPLELADGFDPRWQPSGRTLDAVRHASTIVAPRTDAVQRLKAIGVQDHKIVRLPDIPSPLSRTEIVRAAARNALADINHDLFVRSSDRVVVYIGDLTRKTGVDLMIRALGPIVQEHRALRLWLIGDSPERSRAYEQLRYNGWHNLVAMPGAFEDLDEVLRVADLCVAPMRGQSLGWLIPKCIVSGIPILVGDSPELQQMVGVDCGKTLAFREANADSLHEKLTQWLHDPLPIRRALAAAREHYLSQKPATSWSTMLARSIASYSS
jgi:glycosyltransferase involved in cell wall biosynthesis